MDETSQISSTEESRPHEAETVVRLNHPGLSEKEKDRAWQKEYYLRNREKRIDYATKYYEENREKRLKQIMEWGKKNKDKKNRAKRKYDHKTPHIAVTLDVREYLLALKTRKNHISVCETVKMVLKEWIKLKNAEEIRQREQNI